ncbi:MAG: helix-turn-helix transcriptional regulator [Clostridia bacterium]|nr:helix-turn-helix transcriptional regulator [Clostridia bacterium]
MFKNLIFTIYGRSTMHTDWHIYPRVGINRLYYVHSGSACYICGNKRKTLTPGNIYIFPQNLEFGISMEESDSFDHTYFDFFCSPPLIFENEICINPEKYPLIKAVQEGLLAISEAYPLNTVLERNSYSDAIASSFSAFLDTIHNEYVLPANFSRKIGKVIEYIHLHFSENITVVELSKILFMEENAFIRKFKKHIGITPYQYIKKLRLNLAISMLRSEDSTLDEIASACGYSDACSLSHAIKNEFGKYPGEIFKIAGQR